MLDLNSKTYFVWGVEVWEKWSSHTIYLKCIESTWLPQKAASISARTHSLAKRFSQTGSEYLERKNQITAWGAEGEKRWGVAVKIVHCLWAHQKQMPPPPTVGSRIRWAFGVIQQGSPLCSCVVVLYLRTYPTGRGWLWRISTANYRTVKVPVGESAPITFAMVHFSTSIWHRHIILRKQDMPWYLLPFECNSIT